MKLHPIFSDYVISEEGNVYNFRTQRKLKPYDNGSGYLTVSLYKDKKSHTKSIHRLVLQTYEPIDNQHLYHAHHENEIRDDNRLENLEWELKKEHLRKHKSSISEETRRKLSEMKYWNNGTRNIRSKECPGEGWVRGRV